MRIFLTQFVEKPPGRWFVFVQKDKWPSDSTLSFKLCLPLSHSFQHFPRQGFFLLISALSSVCLYLAVFSISAFCSVFTFSSAFPCWTFLTQFTIALLYHIKSFHYCWHMSTMPQFKVTIAQKVCGSSECLCKTVRTA